MSKPTPYERLLAEELPTGRYLRAWRAPDRPREPLPPTSPEDQRRHAAALLEAFGTGRHARPDQPAHNTPEPAHRRHLTAVPEPKTQENAA